MRVIVVLVHCCCSNSILLLGNLVHHAEFIAKPGLLVALFCTEFAWDLVFNSVPESNCATTAP